MPDIAVGDIVQTRIEWEMYGQKDLTVWHWRVKSAGVGIELFSFLKDEVNTGLAAVGAIIDDMLKHMSEDMKCVGVVSQVIRPIRYRHVRTGLLLAGQDLSVGGTNNLALSVGFAGALAGRGKSGRTQVPGLSKKWQIAGKWDDVPRAHLEEKLTQWRTLDWDFVAPAVVLDPILYTASNGNYNPIVACTAYDTVRTMRRRTLGVGQ